MLLFQQTCFNDNEFVVWLENTEEPVVPPNTPGGRSSQQKKKGPLIDPHTGKAFGFLPPGINAIGIHSGSQESDEDEEKVCPFQISENGTISEKCGGEYLACSICILPQKKRKYINF